MKTFTANEAKQKLGHVLDSARSGPVTITKHGRPEFVLTSKEDYDSMAGLKYENLKREVQKGFDDLNQGRISKRSVAEIAAEALKIHRANSKSPHEA
jgi:prevent-host-death family protein